MKLSGQIRIYTKDFEQDDQRLVEKLADIINGNTQTLFEMGNKRTSLRDNISCSVKDVIVAVDASGKPTTNVSVALDSPQRVEGVTVIGAINLNDQTVFPIAQPFIAYTPQSQSITINRVMGIPSGYQWQLRIVVWQA